MVSRKDIDNLFEFLAVLQLFVFFMGVSILGWKTYTMHILTPSEPLPGCEERKQNVVNLVLYNLSDEQLEFLLHRVSNERARREKRPFEQGVGSENGNSSTGHYTAPGQYQIVAEGPQRLLE